MAWPVVALTLAIGLAFGGFLHDTLFYNHDIDIAWYWLSIAFWVVAALMMLRGVAISTLVSHLQTDLIEVLQANGYWKQPRPLPMYLVGERKQSLPFHDMTGLSYLCTDLAYRF